MSISGALSKFHERNTLMYQLEIGKQIVGHWQQVCWDLRPPFRFRLLYVYKLPLSFFGPFSPIPEKPFPTYSTHHPTSQAGEGREEQEGRRSWASYM